MLKLEKITLIKDDKVILNNVTLEIKDNEFVAITGPNGSGKSTLMKVIMGIETPTSGKIIFNGEDITSLSIYERANKGMAFAFQQPVTFKGITVKDLIHLSAKTKDDDVVMNYLSKVGLCPLNYKDREVDKTLSGGELKRIELASVLARDAELTLFDEPEAGIDLWSFGRLTQLFENMNKTIVIVSHQDKILKLADRIILIKDGEVESVGVYEGVSCDNCEFNKERAD